MRIIRTTAVAAAAAAALAAPVALGTTSAHAAPVAGSAAVEQDYDGWIIQIKGAYERPDEEIAAISARLTKKATDAGLAADDRGNYVLVHTQSYRTVSTLYRFEADVDSIVMNRRMHHM